MLFRMNSGKKIKLRDLALKKRSSYNVLSEAGKVQPKALDPLVYTGTKTRAFGKILSCLSEIMRYASETAIAVRVDVGKPGQVFWADGIFSLRHYIKYILEIQPTVAPFAQPNLHQNCKGIGYG
jgi:hypothetical protein